MKNLILFALFLLLFSCGKNVHDEVSNQKISAVAPYDTIAKDSFSAGTVSVDIARKIRMSSVQYQDSLKQVRKKLEEEKILKDEEDKADKKLAEEKKKAEDAEKGKKEKEKKPAETPTNENAQNP